MLLSSTSDTVPRVKGYHDNLPVEGSNITFSCPPGFILIGPNSTICVENGEWEPDPSGLMCNDSRGIIQYQDFYSNTVLISFSIMHVCSDLWPPI